MLRPPRPMPNDGGFKQTSRGASTHTWFEVRTALSCFQEPGDSLSDTGGWSQLGVGPIKND